jgi:bifunctional non-homologous end joining protein LigD
MLATVGAMPQRLEEFGFEVKWDGYRGLVHWDGSRFLLCSRNGVDLAGRCPEIARMRRALRRPVLLDGEIVAMEKDGRPSFSALQARMPRPHGVGVSRPWDSSRYSLQLMIFDVLHYDGRSTCGLPYADRRTVLESLSLAGPAWQVPPVHPDGPELLRLMRATGQEGLIAKRLASLYEPGRRSSDWIKVKLARSEEFVIIGWWVNGARGLGSLLLGCYPSAADARAGRNLRYCGRVGSGFTSADRAGLERSLMKLRLDAPPAAGAPAGRGLSWCRPLLVAEVQFAEWTPEGALRQARFLGLRADKRPDEVVHRPQR